MQKVFYRLGMASISIGAAPMAVFIVIHAAVKANALGAGFAAQMEALHAWYWRYDRLLQSFGVGIAVY